MTSDDLIKDTLQTSKIIAIVGASVPKENESVSKMRLKPSIIVMKYLLEFGYKVIPVNPFSVGKKVNGETIVEKLEDISSQIDIVNVFRPSKETPDIAKKAIKKKTGARGLRSILENILLKTMFELPDKEDVLKVTIDKSSAKGDSDPIITYGKKQSTSVA